MEGLSHSKLQQAFLRSANIVLLQANLCMYEGSENNFLWKGKLAEGVNWAIVLKCNFLDANPVQLT